ncbi:hypothetical protein ACJX0J_035349 [Zea mays]
MHDYYLPFMIFMYDHDFYIISFMEKKVVQSELYLIGIYLQQAVPGAVARFLWTFGSPPPATTCDCCMQFIHDCAMFLKNSLTVPVFNMNISIHLWINHVNSLQITIALAYFTNLDFILQIKDNNILGPYLTRLPT